MRLLQYLAVLLFASAAWGEAPADLVQQLRGGPVRSEDPKRYEALRRLLGTPPKAKTNNVISSHGNPFQAVAGSPYLAEGEIAVVRPEGGTRFTVVARIRPEDWSGLRDAAGPAS